MTISLEGRIDTSNAAALEQQINQQLASVSSDEALVLDADKLEYISSTGLRLVLGLKKRFDHMEVINLQPDVYNVFEITGFTRIIKATKALRKVSIAGCEEIGRGGVGTIYRLTADSIVKVFQPQCAIDILETERVMAKEAFVLGMPTAIPYDIVWVPETQSYGLIFELISAGTLAASIKAHPEQIEHFGEVFGNELRHLHAIHVSDSTLPLTKEVHNQQLERIAQHFLPEQVELMRTILDMIPEGNSLLHNDCHPKNLMLDANGEPLLIDMGEVSCGHPLYELGHTYSSLHIKDGFEAILGFPQSLAETFWQSTLRTYLQTDDAAVIERYNNAISVLGTLRSCMWIALADFPEETIKAVRQYADANLLPNKEQMLQYAASFKELKF